MEGYTHIAKIYGFRCYFNEETGDVLGTSQLNTLLIDLCIWIDVNMTNNEVFKIEIIQKL
jgi:hypothetical protein